ncbi:MAG: TIGR03564 family F420-dependent LLM class oxidoreductase [Dehalococcoidia bacterium]
MRIGIGLARMVTEPTVENLVAAARRAEQDGFATAWLSHAFGADALTVLALAGRETERIELGTSIVPTYPRHPAALAQQALTVQVATANRLTLGIGLSHKDMIEDALGLDYGRPIPHAREYLTVLTGLLTQQPTRFSGELYRVAAQVQVAGASTPQVLVAALGPAMLRLTGKLADGTAIWMGGPIYLRDVAIPTITAAAAAAGRPAPRIVAGLPVCVTDAAAAARQTAVQLFAQYGKWASYRATLDRSGAAGPEDVALIGTEAEIARRLRELEALGVTDFNAGIFAAPGGPVERTLECMASLARGAVPATP